MQHEAVHLKVPAERRGGAAEESKCWTMVVCDFLVCGGVAYDS